MLKHIEFLSGFLLRCSKHPGQTYSFVFTSSYILALSIFCSFSACFPSIFLARPHVPAPKMLAFLYLQHLLNPICLSAKNRFSDNCWYARIPKWIAVAHTQKRDRYWTSNIGGRLRLRKIFYFHIPTFSLQHGNYLQGGFHLLLLLRRQPTLR